MGCCSSKKKVDVVDVANSAGQAGAVIGGTAGGAVAGATIGAAISGPAAPVGIVVGALVGMAIGQASMKSVGKAVAAPVGVLQDMWRGLCNRPEVLKQLPKIGLLRTVRASHPPAMADLTQTNRYLYTTVPREIEEIKHGEILQAEDLTAVQAQAIADAVKELESRNCLAIAGDDASFVHYQHVVANMTNLPVVLSPLLQAPLIASMFNPTELVLVITADTETLTSETLKKALTKVGLSPDDCERFVLAGCRCVAGFTDESIVMDPVKASDGLLKLVKESISAMPAIKAVLLETTMVPWLADVLRKETGLAIFDNVTVIDFVHKGRTDNPRFGISFGPTDIPQVRLEQEQMPAIGILRIDYTYPPAMGDAAHPNSYYYRTPHATVKGLTFEIAQEGKPLTPELRDSMAKAIGELEAIRGVKGIAGDCGFLINYQQDALDLAKKVPCFISALLQCHLLASMFAPDELILVLTANDKSLAPSFKKILTACHVAEKDQDRFVVRGCQDLPGFEAVALAQKVDVPKVMPHMVKLVTDFRKANPSLRAVLLECTELPPYADAIRHATGLLVLDVITLVDYAHSAASENPYFGIDWQKLADTPAES